jgi:hypothetical protein
VFAPTTKQPGTAVANRSEPPISAFLIFAYSHTRSKAIWLAPNGPCFSGATRLSTEIENPLSSVYTLILSYITKHTLSGVSEKVVIQRRKEEQPESIHYSYTADSGGSNNSGHTMSSPSRGRALHTIGRCTWYTYLNIHRREAHLSTCRRDSGGT